MKKITLLVWLFSSAYTFSQNVTDQSNPNLSFQNFLNGVKYATIDLDEEEQADIDETRYYDDHFLNYFSRYLLDIGFDNVFLTSIEKKERSNIESLCEETIVRAFFDVTNDWELSKVGLRFYTCNGDYFELQSSKKIKNESEEETVSSIIEELYSILSFKPAFNKIYKLSLPFELTEWTESSLKNYFGKNSINELEGIYRLVRNSNDEVINSKYEVGIVKNVTNGFDIIYLSGANNFQDWQEGEKKGEINFTAKANFYTTKWKMSNKSENNDVYCTIDENGFLKIIFSQNSQVRETIESFFLKLYPITNNISSSNKKGTATAFAITQDGYLVTSQHVVDGSSNLKVIMNNSSEQTTYDVSVVLEDKNNDLAILKINDPKFKYMNTIPFTIKSSMAEVGEDVYVLGFPLSTTMGNELKATDGIISSKTGFQGDLTSYQVSAPVQPGNSGGPLFDKKGNLIGIISAKHLAAENVSYAVKSSYLINVINALENPPSLSTKNLLLGKSLPVQIKLLKDYIFMIEVY